MAQNLSFIEKELLAVKRAAAQTTEQMRLLEKAMANVIRQGAKGSGAANLSASGVGVQNVAQRAMANPYMNPAGSPVGGRAIVGSDVNTDKIKGIAKEYDRLKPLLSRQNMQIEALTKAEEAVLVVQHEEALVLNRKIVASNLNIKVQEDATARQMQAADAQSKIPKTLGERVAAWKEEERAAKELAKAELELAKQTKLGALARGKTTKAADIAKDTNKAKVVEQEKYTQQRLEGIFAKQPGAATQVSAIAAKSSFKPEDIKRVTEYANAYTQVQYAVTRTDGVMRKMILTTDRAGNVFTSTQKQFRTFFGAIRRNVTEMIKWSAATLVVWGAIRKLGELLEIAIDNETKLASIAVILGEEHVNLTNVFNSAAEAAAATGESIDGVLEGYVQAYRATGNIADQTERARQAQVLLTDALTLSKLSALTTAEAMDVLTGALRQAGLGFEEGYVLLDKWVAVSNKANVSIETLAESFAITATSASNAGLSWDELNGIIATLAESTTLSATESGNAIRAFIGGFSTDLSIKELSKFGIAVEDTTGETKGFLDVMKEVASLFEAGIISEGELNKISRAIGGRGARRGAQVATTIKNLGRAQEVAEVSTKAHGDAQRALNIQLDTVQTAITKLGNSFQKLARAMGAEGGVLDSAGMILNIFTKMVDATSALVKNLGDMTPILVVMGGLFAATSAQTRGLFATNIATGVGSILGRVAGSRGVGGQQIPIEQQRMDAGLAGGFAVPGQPIGLGSRISQGMLKPGIGRNAGSRLGQGIGVGFAAVSALKDLSEGNKAGAAGSVVGGIVGGLLTAGSPIGIVIGSAAGQAFLNATVNYETEFSKFFGDIFEEVTPGKDKDKPLDTDVATKALFAEFGFGSEGLGKFFAKTFASVGNFAVGGAQVLGNVTGGVAVGDYRFGAGAPGSKIEPQQIALGILGGGQAAENVHALQAKQEALRGFQAEALPSGETFALTDAQAKLLDEWGGFLDDLKATQSEVYRAQAIADDITASELESKLDIIPSLQSSLTKYEALFGDEIRRINDDVNDVADSFEYWTNLVVNGTTEQRANLNAEADDIANLQNAIQLAVETGDKVVLAVDIEETEFDESEVVNLSVAYEMLEQSLADVGIQAQSMTRALNLQRVVIPTVVNLDLAEADFDLFLAEMEVVRDQAFEGWWEEGLNADFSATEIAESFAPFFLNLGQEGAGKMLEGFQQGMASEAFANLIKRGEIVPEAKDEKIGLQQLDISSAELPGVMAEYQKRVSSIQGQLAAKGIEWSPNEELFAALLNDNVALPITADLTLLNIAMQELIDVSKDQLDGIYNLPTDATFYVPVGAWQMQFANQGGGLGGDLSGYGGETKEDVVEKAAKLVRPDRWQIEQDARIQNQLDKLEDDSSVVRPRGRARGVGTRKDRDVKPFEGLQLPSPKVWFDKVFGGLLRTLVGPPKGIDPLGIPFGGGPLGAAGGGGGPLGGELGGILGQFKDLIGGLFGLNGEDPTITTKLQIESTTTTIVQLDGQVIANAIKPYLLNDEVRYEGTGGSVVKRFVI